MNWDAPDRLPGRRHPRCGCGNSAVYAFGALAITLVVSIPAGYALALTEFRGRRPLLIITLVVMLMPTTALVLPLFLELNAVHLIGSPLVGDPAVLVLPVRRLPDLHLLLAPASPRTCWPRRGSTAAREFRAFRRVALPLAAPIVALVGFFSFVANWNNFFLPFVMLPQSNQYPIQVGLALLLTDVPQFNPTAAGGHRAATRLALATLVAIAPVLIVFLFSSATWSRADGRRDEGVSMTHVDIAASVPLLEPPGLGPGRA